MELEEVPIPFDVVGASAHANYLVSDTLPTTLQQVIKKDVATWSYEMDIRIIPPSHNILDKAIPGFRWAYHYQGFGIDSGIHGEIVDGGLRIRETTSDLGPTKIIRPPSLPEQINGGYAFKSLPSTKTSWTITIRDSGGDLIGSTTSTLHLSNFVFGVRFAPTDVFSMQQRGYASRPMRCFSIYATSLNNIAADGSGIVPAIGAVNASASVVENFGETISNPQFTLNNPGFFANATNFPLWGNEVGKTWIDNQLYMEPEVRPAQGFARESFEINGVLTSPMPTSDADTAFIQNMAIAASRLYDGLYPSSGTPLFPPNSVNNSGAVRIRYQSPFFATPLNEGVMITWEWHDEPVVESIYNSSDCVLVNRQFATRYSATSGTNSGYPRMETQLQSHLSSPFRRVAPVLTGTPATARARSLVRPSGELKSRNKSVLWQHPGQARFWAGEPKTGDVLATDDEGETFQLMANAWSDVSGARPLDFVALPFGRAGSIAKLGTDIVFRYSPDGVIWNAQVTVCLAGSGIWSMTSHAPAGHDTLTITNGVDKRFDSTDSGATWSAV